MELDAVELARAVLVVRLEDVDAQLSEAMALVTRQGLEWRHLGTLGDLIPPVLERRVAQLGDQRRGRPDKGVDLDVALVVLRRFHQNRLDLYRGEAEEVRIGEGGLEGASAQDAAPALVIRGQVVEQVEPEIVELRLHEPDLECLPNHAEQTARTRVIERLVEQPSALVMAMGWPRPRAGQGQGLANWPRSRAGSRGPQGRVGIGCSWGADLDEIVEHERGEFVVLDGAGAVLVDKGHDHAHLCGWREW